MTRSAKADDTEGRIRALASFREIMEARLATLEAAIQTATDQRKLLRDTGRDDHRRIWERHQNSVAYEREYVLSVVERVEAVANARWEESRKALDAAFAATKEAGAKAEAGTKEQLTSIRTEMGTSFGAILDQIGDLKSRMDRVEAAQAARTEQHTESRLTLGQVMVALGLLISTVALVASLLIVKA